jgi:hypothetical protein
MMSIITTYLHVYPDTLGSAQTKSVGELPKHEPQILVNIEDESGGFVPKGSVPNSVITGSSKHDDSYNGIFSDRDNGVSYRESKFIKQFGSDEYHNIMQPTVSGYAWIRTA